jgi:predicted  nucleic acid-binding Zn-ribbon protein
MNLLQSLENKVVVLVGLVQRLKQENAQLKEDISGFEKEKKELKKQIDMLESSMLKESNRLQEQLQKEKELTKTVVDDLIRNIDAIVEGENQPS